MSLAAGRVPQAAGMADARARWPQACAEGSLTKLPLMPMACHHQIRSPPPHHIQDFLRQD
eukprot:CAMPEP_0170575860 /NCGR_PEP_ID=MMETSP0224-20130122/4088_1 /TAXON_ID=285029 /ORGANISM="Togula jolla, Strain CCCM 725" /LENGTH=59 /DNA_ID=CAMNT_0010898671 /DNA_START=81 /DNA_END=260 /DNA_ORIENTATION=-